MIEEGVEVRSDKTGNGDEGVWGIQKNASAKMENELLMCYLLLYDNYHPSAKTRFT